MSQPRGIINLHTVINVDVYNYRPKGGEHDGRRKQRQYEKGTEQSQQLPNFDPSSGKPQLARGHRVVGYREKSALSK